MVCCDVAKTQTIPKPVTPISKTPQVSGKPYSWCPLLVVLVTTKSMEMWIFWLYLAQNWTKSHDSCCKMKLFEILNKMEQRKYYVILIFWVQGWLSTWGQILTWSNDFFFWKNGYHRLKVHKKLSGVGLWILQFGEHLVKISLAQVGKNGHIIANVDKNTQI